MNPALIPPPPQSERPAEHGSGRYFARMSQSESIGDPEDRRFEFRWHFEAFDASWFVETEPPRQGERVAFYEKARIYVVEVHFRPRERVPLGQLELILKHEHELDEEQSWWYFETAAAAAKEPAVDGLYAQVYGNLFGPGAGRVIRRAERVDENMSRLLEQTIDTNDIPDATEEQVRAALQPAASVPLSSAVVYDVGQGNAIGFCDIQNYPQVYFDLGGGVLANTFTRPAALRSFCFTRHPVIVLSHWDYDHWSSAQLPANWPALRMTWIAPRQRFGPFHVAMIASIEQAGGSLRLLAPGFPARWYGQVHLELCTGSGRNHSGIAVTLAEHPQGRGELMLFPGDARYSAIPSFAAQGSPTYLSAVAPHHGGNMHNMSAPLCASRPASRLVYSYGAGNTFDHPAQITRRHHHGARWRDPAVVAGSASDVRETADRRPDLGHVLLSWSSGTSQPQLPCAARHCQLQPVHL